MNLLKVQQVWLWYIRMKLTYINYWSHKKGADGRVKCCLSSWAALPHCLLTPVSDESIWWLLDCELLGMEIISHKSAQWLHNGSALQCKTQRQTSVSEKESTAVLQLHVCNVLRLSKCQTLVWLSARWYSQGHPVVEQAEWPEEAAVIATGWGQGSNWLDKNQKGQKTLGPAEFRYWHFGLKLIVVVVFFEELKGRKPQTALSCSIWYSKTPLKCFLGSNVLGHLHFVNESEKLPLCSLGIVVLFCTFVGGKKIIPVRGA